MTPSRARQRLGEIRPRLPRGDYQLEYLALSTSLAVGAFCEQGYDHGLWSETVYHSEKNLRKLLQEVMMVPVIVDQEGAWFTMPDDKEAKRVYRVYPDRGYHYLPQTEFMRRFYP